MTSHPGLHAEIVDTIAAAVNLRDLDRSKLTPETPLAQGGLGLDSVDVLESVVAIEQRFKVKVANAEMGRKYFRTLGTIAQLIEETRARA